MYMHSVYYTATHISPHITHTLCTIYETQRKKPNKNVLSLLLSFLPFHSRAFRCVFWHETVCPWFASRSKRYVPFRLLCVYVLASTNTIQLSIFVQRFFTEGPGAPGIDMDNSIKLMEQYNDEFKLLEQQRQEFGMAKRNFTQNASDYMAYISSV